MPHIPDAKYHLKFMLDNNQRGSDKKPRFRVVRLSTSGLVCCLSHCGATNRVGQCKPPEVIPFVMLLTTSSVFPLPRIKPNSKLGFLLLWRKHSPFLSWANAQKKENPRKCASKVYCIDKDEWTSVHHIKQFWESLGFSFSLSRSILLTPSQNKYVWCKTWDVFCYY